MGIYIGEKKRALTLAQGYEENHAETINAFAKKALAASSGSELVCVGDS